jgi:hypothetical protein
MLGEGRGATGPLLRESRRFLIYGHGLVAHRLVLIGGATTVGLFPIPRGRQDGWFGGGSFGKLCELLAEAVKFESSWAMVTKGLLAPESWAKSS